jgi:hypothetical protein
MGRALAAVAVVCSLVSSGCGARGGSAGEASAVGTRVGKGAVGRWSVVAVGGKPVPAGASVVVDYRPDGRMVVESTGDGAPRVDEAKLKPALDGLDVAGMVFTTLKVNVGGYEVEMKRHPGTTISVPPRGNPSP